MRKAVAYYRVSTDKQGKSGLGLDAQRAAVKNYAIYNSINIDCEFMEVESGRKNKRPILLDAMTYCKKHKAILIIAKLDRLSRNVAFISALMESRVKFVAVDNPQADELHLHILAAIAQHERKQASERTKAALQAAKRRGVILGRTGREIHSIKNAAAARQFAQAMRPKIEELKSQGITTIRAICAELNQQEVPTYRGGANKWHFCTVQSLIKRIATNTKPI